MVLMRVPRGFFPLCGLLDEKKLQTARRECKIRRKSMWMTGLKVTSSALKRARLATERQERENRRKNNL